MLFLHVCYESEPEYQKDPGSSLESPYTSTPAYLFHNLWWVEPAIFFFFFEDFQAILM